MHWNRQFRKNSFFWRIVYSWGKIFIPTKIHTSALSSQFLDLATKNCFWKEKKYKIVICPISVKCNSNLILWCLILGMQGGSNVTSCRSTHGGKYQWSVQGRGVRRNIMFWKTWLITVRGVFSSAQYVPKHTLEWISLWVTSELMLDGTWDWYKM